MIKIIISDEEQLVFKHYPINRWIGFICSSIVIIFLTYHSLFQSPTDSSLICSKEHFNQTNCELVESSTFKLNLTHEYIQNVKNPHKKLGSKNNTIWLKTDLKLLQGKIKNIYYPSSSFLDPPLYPNNKLLLDDVGKINTFIHKNSEHQILIIKREVHQSFYIVILITLLFWLCLNLFFFVHPVKTYLFDWRNNIFALRETNILSSKEKKFLLKKITILPGDNNQVSFIRFQINNHHIYSLEDNYSHNKLMEILFILKAIQDSK